MNASDSQPDLADEALGLLGCPGCPGASPSELRDQMEMDALLRLQTGELCVPPGLVGRIRRLRWQRRVWRVLELATAAVILITFGVCVFRTPPPYRLDGRAAVMDDRGQSASLAPGAWIQTADADAILRVRRHTRIEISPRTRLQLAGPGEKCHLKLDYGQIALTLEKGGGEVLIETAAGKVTAGGDSSSLRVRVEKKGGPADRELTVTVVAGQATLDGANGIVQLDSGDVRTSATAAKHDSDPPATENPRRVPPIPPVPAPPGVPNGQGEAAPAATGWLQANCGH